MHLPDQLTLNWIFLGSTVLLVSLSASLAVFFVSKRRREVLEARRITPTSFAPAISFFPPSRKSTSKVSLNVTEDHPSPSSSNLDVKNLEKKSGLDHII